MRNTATHQVPAATTKPSRLTLPEIAYALIAVTVMVGGAVFFVQLIAGLFAPTADPTDGVCRQYSNQVFVCVPAYSPDGAEMTHMWEDGSAEYSDGHVFGGYSESDCQFMNVGSDLDPMWVRVSTTTVDGLCPAV